MKVRQHYVPQFYLKNFGDPIQTFDKFLGKKFHASSKDIAFQNNFYGGGIEKTPSLEIAFSSIEGDSATAIHELMNTENYQQLSDKSKIRIHNFLSLQYIRTPAYRQEKVGFSKCILNEIAKQIGIDDHTVKPTEQGKIGLHLQTIADYPLYGMVIGHMKFVTMINKTAIPFWTSDNPVCFNNFVPSSMGNLGIISTGVQIHFPISPKLMLVALDPIFFQDLPETQELYNKKAVSSENFLQVENSTRWLFSNTKRFRNLGDMLKKYPHLKNPDRDRAQIVTGTYQNSDVIGFMRQSPHSGVLREGGLSTWMPMEKFEEIKEMHEKNSKSRKLSPQDNSQQDSEQQSSQ